MTESSGSGSGTRPAKPAEPTMDARIDSFLRAFSRTRKAGAGRKQQRPKKTVRVLVHWPAEQWDAMAEHWPQFVPEYGDDHDTHRRMVEDMLRRHAEDSSATFGVASLTVDGLIGFARAQELDPAASETRAAYAAELGRAGQVTSWPPGRRQKCWCGSGEAYGDCCGATG